MSNLVNGETLRIISYHPWISKT